MKTELGLGQTTTDADHATDQTLAASSRSSAPLVGAASGPADEPKRGDSIGRFVVLGVLGAGGMGVVYSAYDPHLDRKVAIKLLASTARTEAASLRMLREAQAMAKINHPNVIKVHEVGTFEDQIYLALEFADDGTLRSWLKEKHSLAEILDVFTQAGRGLAAAHALGLVHRDFKPDNVLKSKTGAVQVTDFGLVSVVNAVVTPTELPSESIPIEISTQGLTQTGSVMGTPQYMAPEQFQGNASTASTDQFAFCVALYDALYKMRPFAGANYAELLVSVTQGDVLPAPPDAKVPGRIRKVLLRGLAVDPAQRWPSINDLLAALSYDPAKRRRRIAMGAAAVVLLGGVGLAVATRETNHCSSGDDRIAAVWNPVQRAQLATVFNAATQAGAKPALARIDEILDGWTASWKVGFVGACRATRDGAQSEHLLDLRMQCLDRQLDQTRIAIDTLGHGGVDVIIRGVDLALALPSVEPCADTAALIADVPPPAPAVKNLVAEADKQIDKAFAEDRLGSLRQAHELAAQALVAARATGYQVVIAKALRQLARIETELVEPSAADTFEQAIQAAAAIGDTNGMVMGLIGRFTTLVRTDHFEAAQELADFADSLALSAHLSVYEKIQLDDNIAYLLAKRGKIQEARVRYERSLVAARSAHDDEALLLTLAQLGDFYKEHVSPNEAEKPLVEAMDLAVKLYGASSNRVADRASDLGNVYRDQIRIDDAKRLYDKALAIRLAALGPDHPNIGTSYNSIGTFYSELGDDAPALGYFEKALAVWEKAYGKDSVELLPALLNIGQIYQGRGDSKTATQWYERARTIVVAAHGPDHPDVANVLVNLGALAVNDGRYTEALDLLGQARRIFVKVDDKANAAICSAEMLEPLRELGHFDEAEAQTKVTIAEISAAFGADHPTVGKIYESFSHLETKRNNLPKALEYAMKALSILEAKLGKDHPDVGTLTMDVSQVLAASNRSREAVPYAERAVAIAVATKQPPANIARARFTLAYALGADPKSKRRAISEATAALPDATPNEAADIKIWLRKHR